VSHVIDTLSGVDHHEGHEEHEGRGKDIQIRTFFLIRLSVLRVLRALRGEEKNIDRA
jgi:hypothetical protein